MSITSNLSPANENPPVALVAGASRGLGLLIARELAERQHHVVICARDADELASAQRMLRELGHEVDTRVCDVSDADAVAALVEQVEREVGPIEVLVTVAGVIQVGPLESVQRQHFQQAIDIMLWGPVNLALAVLPGMRQRRRGHIATVTSIGGIVSVPHLLPYSTAKFGAVGFSQGLRAELAGTGISVTTIVPGLMRTGSHLRARFTGNHAAEYAWFATGASMPLVAMDADRAAARIVDRVLAGRSMVVLTPLAKIGMRVHGLAPATTAALLGAVGRLLPSAPPGDDDTSGQPGGRDAVEGREAQRSLGPRAARVLDVLTVLGSRAAQRNNEGGAASSVRVIPPSDLRE